MRGRRPPPDCPWQAASATTRAKIAREREGVDPDIAASSAGVVPPVRPCNPRIGGSARALLLRFGWPRTLGAKGTAVAPVQRVRREMGAGVAPRRSGGAGRKYAILAPVRG